jgi:hypothetical protein
MSKIEQSSLKELLNLPAGQAERQPDCPDDYQLASYMEGGLSERDHIQFEAHLADCTFCIERVGALGRAGEAPSVDAIPDAQHDHSHRTPKSRRASRWATAALVVLAVGFIANRQVPDRVSSIPGTPQDQGVTTERFIEQASPFPEILSPLEGGLVDPRSFVFRWKEVPGSLFYDIRIVSDDGAQIARQRVWDTQWSLPPETQLRSGDEYFVRVDAYISEGKSISSEHTVFKVGDTRP